MARHQNHPALFGMLHVFPGSFDLEAAGYVLELEDQRLLKVTLRHSAFFIYIAAQSAMCSLVTLGFIQDLSTSRVAARPRSPSSLPTEHGVTVVADTLCTDANEQRRKRKARAV